MKKILTLCVAAMMAITTVSAKSYTYAIGVVTGLEWGAGLKVNLTEHLTVLNDLSWVMMPRTVFGTEGGSVAMGYSGLIDNANVAYQMPLTNGQGIELNLYAGGGLSLGWANVIAENGAGKFGINALVGIEANITNAPIEFTFDFRPGYATLFTKDGALHGFDWGLVLGVRYTL